VPPHSHSGRPPPSLWQRVFNLLYPSDTRKSCRHTLTCIATMPALSVYPAQAFIESRGVPAPTNSGTTGNTNAVPVSLVTVTATRL